MRIKDEIFCFAHLRWCHDGWESNILIVVDTGPPVPLSGYATASGSISLIYTPSVKVSVMSILSQLWWVRYIYQWKGNTFGF